jgi:uncharacterized protein with PIN domain
MDYVMQENDRGKQTPTKIGLAPIQRDDTEYEFDIVLDINRNHIATASKDTTFLDKYNSVIKPFLGQEIVEWLNEGKEPERCEECNTIIKPYAGLSPTELIERSKAKYEKVICVECAKKLSAEGNK